MDIRDQWSQGAKGNHFSQSTLVSVIQKIKYEIFFDDKNKKEHDFLIFLVCCGNGVEYPI
jgi:hypothetical protein